MTTAHRYVYLHCHLIVDIAENLDPHSTPQEGEITIKLPPEHSMQNHSLHTPNSNSDTKDKLQKLRLHNEISELSSSERKPNTDGKLVKAEL